MKPTRICSLFLSTALTLVAIAADAAEPVTGDQLTVYKDAIWDPNIRDDL